MPRTIARNAPSLPGKPLGCRSCKLCLSTKGFLPDNYKGTERIAIMFDAPQADAITWSDPFAGDVIEAWVKRNLTAQGYERRDVFITHVLRCKQRGGGRFAYPQAEIARNAESACRQYDDSLHAYEPNAFVITHDAWATYQSPSLQRIIQADVRKAFALAAQGLRPLLLCGERPTSLIWQHPFRPGNGGIKAWRGHYFEGNWPYTLQATQ